MKKRISILLFSASMFLLTGCPYYSDFGLSNAKKSLIDTSLTGNWRVLNEESTDTADLEIVEFNEHELYLELRYTEKNQRITERYRGYLTNIEDQKIINLKKLGTDQRFMFFKYKTGGKSLELSYASDDFIKTQFLSQKKLYAFFKKNIHQQEMFEDKMTYFRK
jgi:hypothetical protein